MAPEKQKSKTAGKCSLCGSTESDKLAPTRPTSSSTSEAVKPHDSSFTAPKPEEFAPWAKPDVLPRVTDGISSHDMYPGITQPQCRRTPSHRNPRLKRFTLAKALLIVLPGFK